MGNIDIGAAFNFAIERFKANPAFYIVFGLVLGAMAVASAIACTIISFILFFLPGFLAQPFLFLCFLFIFSIICGSLLLGFFKAVKKEASGEKAEIGEIFSAYGNSGELIASTIISIIGQIGFAFCVIPGVILFPLLPLSLFIVAGGDSSENGMGALKKSLEILKGAPILILYFLLLGLLADVGILACGIGFLFTAPIAFLCMWHVCCQAAGGSCSCGCQGGNAEVADESGTPS